MAIDVCTIIAKNYLAYARVLARSLAEHHPEVTFHVLIIDDLEGYLDPGAEPFEILTPGQLEIASFERMSIMYDVLELSTAVKPWLLRRLLAEGADGAVYLDPDMRLYAPLDEVFERVREPGLVLSPHNLEPMPRDGRKPSEQDVLIAGVYNLGFIGIGQGSRWQELLGWWSERLEYDCIVDPKAGLFVDQRWIDFVPGMTEHLHILRDPGFNVAYWNLATRPVSERAGSWWVKGDIPLRLFHYSGFDPERPHLLSKFQNRLSLSELPDLARLCSSYADELLAAGAREVSEWPYTHGATASGMPLERPFRRLYRELALEGFSESVFGPDGEERFLEAAAAPATSASGGEQGVTRLLAAVHSTRGDLQAAFPDLASEAGGRGLVEWARTYGLEEEPVLQRMSARSAGAPTPGDELKGGVNIVGYLRSELGVGEIARQVIQGLDAVGVPTLPVGIVAPGSRQEHPFLDAGVPSTGYPVNLLCVNADMVPSVADQLGAGFFEGRYTVGLWWWETSSFPDRWQGAFEHVDEVWAGSSFVADAIRAVSPVPVRQLPMPVTLPEVPGADRAATGLPEGFLFLFVYDFNSVLERKNPIGLIDAFVRAFPDADEGPALVLKSINADQHPEEHERLKLAAAGHPHVRLLDTYMSVEAKNRLLAGCDCYVSLHRSEGFGIGMAEAMLMGRPVIATAYSGNLEFMRPENSYLVNHQLTRIGPGRDPYPPDGVWAEPDLDHAAELMREVVENPDEAARRGAVAAADIRRAHSAEACGHAMAGHLEAAGRLLRQREGAGRAVRDAKVGGRLRRLPRTAAGRVAARMAPLKPRSRRLEELEKRQRDADANALKALRALERGLTARLDDLTGQVDTLRAEQAEQGRTLFGVGLAAAPDPGSLADGYPAPAEPWSLEYNRAHRLSVCRVLDEAALVARFRERERLPEGLGAGFDERMVEYPWLAAQRLGGRVLDAGSTLNHLHVLTRLRGRVDDLDIVTLAPEDDSFTKLGISYLYADLRDLPLVDNRYDRVLSISTLEHVGLDNSHFGQRQQPVDDPQAELLKAVRELHRVLRPGGDCYITVPVGRGERFEWVRSLAHDEVDEIVHTFEAESSTCDYFLYGRSGWQLSDREGTAEARYRDHLTSDGVDADGVVAAEAVACLHLVKAS